MRPAVLVTFLSLLCLGSGWAQMAAGAASTVATRYVWRGVTRVSGWVVQPTAWVAARAGGIELSASVWGNWELGAAGPADLTQRGVSRRGFGELDLDLAVASALGAVDIGAGWTRYTFHGDPSRGGRGSADNTSEIFARAEWQGSPVTPGFLAACDVGRVRGCYFEGGVALPIFATPEARPRVVLSVEPTAGWSEGEDPNSNDPSQLANFGGNGLTHIDLPLFVRFQISGRALEPALSLGTHVQWCRDGATRITSTTGSTRVKLWLELGATLVTGLARERRR
jgi:hypothetical protein